jgi:hypothetical protein
LGSGFLDVAGGGGTDFDQVFRMWVNLKRSGGRICNTRYFEEPFDFYGIILTDGGVSYNNSVKYVKEIENVMFLHPRGASESLAPLKKLIDSDKYPNIRAIEVDFNTQNPKAKG